MNLPETNLNRVFKLLIVYIYIICIFRCIASSESTDDYLRNFFWLCQNETQNTVVGWKDNGNVQYTGS